MSRLAAKCYWCQKPIMHRITHDLGRACKEIACYECGTHISRYDRILQIVSRCDTQESYWYDLETKERV